VKAVRHVNEDQFELRDGYDHVEAIQELVEYSEQREGGTVYFMLDTIPIRVNAHSDPRLLATDVNRAKMGIIRIVGPKYSYPTEQALRIERDIADTQATLNELIELRKQLG
jgi:hypothetical protein